MHRMQEATETERNRNRIIERLVGATGDPDRVVATARSTGIRALATVQEMLLERFSTPFDVDLAEVEIVRLADAKPSPDSLDVYVVLSAPTMPSALTMRLDPAALSLLVAHFFGGDPEIPPAPLKRPASGIELDVATLAFEIFAQAINGHGQRALGLRISGLRPMAGQVALKRFILRDGPGVRMDFSIGSGDVSGRLTAWMPQRVLLEGRTAPEGAVKTPEATEWSQRFSEQVLRSGVTLVATVPLMKMQLGEITELQPGQIIEMGEDVRGKARLSVRGRILFDCDLGKLGQNYTVRVKRRFDARNHIVNGLVAEHGREE